MKKTLLTLIIIFVSFITLPAKAIKVGIVVDAAETYIASSCAAQIVDIRTNKSLYKIDAMRLYPIKSQRNSINIKINNKYYDLGTNAFVLKTETAGFLSAKNKWYRGDFVITSSNNMLTIINNVGLEEYLMGVVPSEMPAKWNDEALKAQTIAARSYAIANMGKRGSKGYDLNDTTEDQVYGGASAETIKTNKIISETKGVVVTHNGQVIPAYYHASAGGQTNNSGELWSKDQPFLKSVPSFDDNVKRMGHGVGMSQYGANNLAQQGYNAYQILTYFYNNIKFGKLSADWNI